MAQSVLPEGNANCGINGGVKVESGLDKNRDGELDADEVVSTSYVCNGDGSNEMSAKALRNFIDNQVGIENLVVPENDADIPFQTEDLDGRSTDRYETTEAKRYLGKHLFHDPVRTLRILPSFGGVQATAGTASCRSCHSKEAGTKAGQTFNFAVGGEGLGYTEADGNFVVRRRPRVDILPRLRTEPLFPGDALVDALPTLTDVYQNTIGNPALGQLSESGSLLHSGRLDGLDSVGRLSPSVIGFAYNNRLLLDGFAGERDETRGGLNPFQDPAQENLTLLLLDAHRMFTLQEPQPAGGVNAANNMNASLQSIPAFVELFRRAFPAEAREADAPGGTLDTLINDQTVLRATATYLRTVVTRNSPWDDFLAGDDSALTPAQLRGAKLFFTSPENGQGGAGCSSCHMGPMLNKQANDGDVAGIGELVEENFHNLGLSDHPLQGLNRQIRLERAGETDVRDLGRKEITGRDEDAFKFRTLTLRQLKDGRNFMHNALFTSVKDVVDYFNEGVPQDEQAGETATRRFTNPRGDGYDQGLGLSSGEVNDLTDFLENALHDQDFVVYDPSSTTRTFHLNKDDLNYSVNYPELSRLGAVDGQLLSGLAEGNNDPLSRRDLGLEFLDVTNSLNVELTDTDNDGSHRYEIYNAGTAAIDTHLLVLVDSLPAGVELENADAISGDGLPYVRLFLEDGLLEAGESVFVDLDFSEEVDGYLLTLKSGQGNP